MSKRTRSKKTTENLDQIESKKTRSSLSSKLSKLNDKTDFNEKTDDLNNENINYWLMKSEPESRIENGHEMKFGFDDLKANENQTTCWDGVRNYEARNHMKSMKLDDRAFFYHSNCKNPGIIGIVRICKEAYVDHTAFDVKDPHYDPKSDKNNPKWFMVDVKFERDLKRFIPLSELKEHHLKHKNTSKGPLVNLSLFTRSRLSVQSIKKEEWDFILSLEDLKHESD